LFVDSTLKGNAVGESSSQDSTVRGIVYLSRPAEVSMADRWFEVASVEHFWIRRRFDILRRVAGDLIADAGEVAEIGCGHGLLQRQIEGTYAKEVAGFDLNEFALKHNQSFRSGVYCYDIFQKHPPLRERFDLILLFDVLEHISDEDAFLTALLFHLAPDGKVVLNVPAGPWAYSAYDRAAGHVRRYSARSLRDTIERNRLEVARWSYWGFPLLPSLIARNLWLAGISDEGKIISEGFDSRTDAMNHLLTVISRFELIPQRVLGTSLMAVVERAPGTG
jgi:SAM-dependent methyltransferase